MKPTWLVVLRPDGEVLEVQWAPHAWIGRHIDACEGLTAEARAAAHELLEAAARDPRGPAVRRAMVEALGDAPAIELLVLSAVPLRRTPTDMNALVMRTMETLMEQAHAMQVNLHVDAREASREAVLIDQEKIAWGVATLVGGALRYMGPSAALEKRITVGVSLDEAKRELVIAVSDNGPGIPEARRQYLLHPDPETNQRAGLALLVIQDVVRAHGGRFEVTSSTEPKHHGTTIALRIPVGRTEP